MEGVLISKLLLPLVLFAVMFGMGLSLTPGDFRRVAATPRALLVGLACQLLALPLVGFGLLGVIEVQPTLAVGLMILTFCPGGTASNMLSYLAGGDLALSVTLTAIVSLIAPFTLPPLTNLALAHWLGDNAELSLPIMQTVVVLLLITVLPIGIGMLIKARRPSFAERSQRFVKVGSVVALLAITVVIVIEQWSRLPAWFAQVGLICVVLGSVSMTLGYVAGIAARLERAQSITIAIEVGVQNGATGLFVTGTLLGDAQMAISPVVYSLGIMVLASGFGVLVHRRGLAQ